MNTDTKLKVILFALTGFGNPVLNALLNDARLTVQAVFTVKYDHPFPYYAERQLLEVCAEQGVICYHDVKVGSEEGLRPLHNFSPDLILISTFKQIIRENVLRLPRLGVINFHPALLPSYRGPCPTNAALLNGDRIAGVTVHYVTEGVDAGNILLQRSISIDEIENDGELRHELAELSGEVVPEMIGMFTGSTKPVGLPQDHTRATHAPKPTVEEGYLERVTDVKSIRNRMRALNPLPGTSYLLGDRRITVDQYQLIQADRADGVYDQGDSIDLVIDSQAIRLFKKAQSEETGMDHLPDAAPWQTIPAQTRKG